MKLVLIGVGLGIVAAAAMTRSLRSLLYEVTPTDAVTFTSVGLLLLAIALFACWLPARRAARVEPMEALRHE
jgi:putative ABC transport system permease protein